MTAGSAPGESRDSGGWIAGFLQAQTDVYVNDAARFAELARWWLLESSSRLCPVLWGRVIAGDRSIEATVGRRGISWLGDAEWSVGFTPKRFDTLLDSLNERGLSGFWSLDRDVRRVAVGECSGMIASFSCGIGPRHSWVSFMINAWYRGSADGLIPDLAQQQLVDFVGAFSEQAHASFANIADDNDSGQTALEVFLPRNPVDSVLQSLDVLRGYSWVTVCPPNVVERLGGAEALEASGAFVEVRPLGYGAVLLRATERFEQYDDAAMARVFHALAPALPPGKPKKIRIFDGQPTPRLVYEDSADYQH